MAVAFASAVPFLGDRAGGPMTDVSDKRTVPDNDPRANAGLRRRNLLLAWILGVFAVAVMVYSMRFIWPHVDIFSR